ncbi:hypothetical protein [Umezawaea tangerina]|uniref:hypothetical protein n=1 Tax=Umezawaea tangerina TaxID=84725 RepID=UPI0011B29D93|nr:hypothetical protein [Umezawaea tangerina]
MTETPDARTLTAADAIELWRRMQLGKPLLLDLIAAVDRYPELRDTIAHLATALNGDAVRMDSGEVEYFAYGQGRTFRALARTVDHHSTGGTPR